MYRKATLFKESDSRDFLFSSADLDSTLFPGNEELD